MANADGLAAIVSGLEAFPDNVDVAYWACRAVINAGANTKAAKTFRELGAIKYVMHALQLHMNDFDVALHAVWAFRNMLAVDGTKQRVDYCGFCVLHCS